MKLLRMSVNAVRAVPDGSYAFSSATTSAPLDTVFVTGPQDSGKTSFLEAVAAAKEAIGSYGAPPDVRRLLRKGATRGRIITVWLLSDEEQRRAELTDAYHTVTWTFGADAQELDATPRLRRLFGAYSSNPTQGKFELFPANRSLLQGESRGAPRPVPDPAEGRLRMTSAPEKYAGLRACLNDLMSAEANRVTEALTAHGIVLRSRIPGPLVPMVQSIHDMLPDVAFAAVERGDRSPRVFFNRRNGIRVELDELSSSEEQGVLFGTTIARYGLSHSVLLVDTPEMHIHPRRHVDFFAALSGCGRDNQIIAATTSAELLATARPEQIIDLAPKRG